MADPTQPPAPPSRAALAAVLAQAGKPDCPLLADRPVAEILMGAQRVDLASGWQLTMEWDCDWWHPAPVLGRLLSARAPDGGTWSYGCDRWPDWNAGPDAVVLEPLRHLLTSEQRERLWLRLLSCNCWPAPDQPPQPPRFTPEQVDELMSLEFMAS